jgi:hypothetical protein
MSADGSNDDGNVLNDESFDSDVPPNGENGCFSICLSIVGSLGRSLDCDDPPPKESTGWLGDGELSVFGFVLDDFGPNGEKGSLSLTLDDLVVEEEEDDDDDDDDDDKVKRSDWGCLCEIDDSALLLSNGDNVCLPLGVCCDCAVPKGEKGLFFGCCDGGVEI